MTAKELKVRIKAHFRLKALLGLALTTGIWFCYLGIQQHPLFPVKVLKFSLLDRLIPFIPAAVYPYESIWLLMPIAPWLMSTRQEIACYTKGLLAISLTCFSFFFFYPTAIARPDIHQNINFLYATLIKIDSPSNAFPSLHAAYAVFHGAWCHKIFSASRAAACIWLCIWLWVLLILASTLLTRQHVLADMAAGTLLGGAGFTLFTHCPNAETACD